MAYAKTSSLFGTNWYILSINPNSCLFQLRKQQKYLMVCFHIMYQVANLNPKDLSYTLKDYVFKELQRDWPGYNEIDRRSLESVLSK